MKAGPIIHACTDIRAHTQTTIIKLLIYLTLSLRVRAALQQVGHHIVEPAGGCHHQGRVPVVVRLLQVGLCVRVW